MEVIYIPFYVVRRNVRSITVQTIDEVKYPTVLALRNDHLLLIRKDESVTGKAIPS